MYVMRTLLLVLFAAACSPSPLAAVDTDFLRAWETAQKARPAHIAATARIAPASEPGTPMTIHGRVVGTDGAVVSDAVVFAWQTDMNGRYDRPDAPPHSWRLRGWALSGKGGTFTFHTIRPGAYPNGQEPEHVHFTVQTPKGERFFTDDLNFADDPLLARSRNRDAAAKVTTREGRQHVEVTLRLEATSRF